MTPIIWLSKHPKWMYKQKEKAISLLSLSVFNPPDRDWLMGIFKGYFDDSGDEKDPQEKASCLAGYVATAEQWEYFEEKWREALKKHDVPYLHMNEFTQFRGPYGKYKDNEEGRIALLQSLIKVMGKAQLEGIASVIKMPDLIYFNNRKNQDINAYAFNLLTCMNIITEKWPNTDIEMALDRTNKLGPKIHIAIEYCQSKEYYGAYNDKIIPIPLSKGLNFKKVLPIQAADLLAWEIRKDVIKNSYEPIPISDPPFPIDGPMFVPPSEWPALPKPPIRKSLVEILGLVDLNEVPVWNYIALCHLPMFIHPSDIHWYHQKLLEKAKNSEDKEIL